MQVYTNPLSAFRTKRFLGKAGERLQIFRCRRCGRIHFESPEIARVFSNGIPVDPRGRASKAA
jgi:ribosomal protein L37E